MTGEAAPTSISKEGLLGKSRVYVQRAFRAKQAGDLDEYQLWLSLALELLGKAALANIHSSLVVDPNHYESLFAASGRIISSDIKTIGAGTLYKRLSHLSKYFDKSVKDFCDAISLRRNAELHSGELPFHQMKLDAWEGRFWHAAQIILSTLDSSLEEWLGADRAKAPKQLLAEAKVALKEAAKLRVEQAREHFLVRPKKDRDSALAQSNTKHSYHFPGLFVLMSDHEWAAICPACTGRAFFAGIIFGEEVLDPPPGEERWEEHVEKNYGAEEFRCPTCDLHLNSREEIEAVGLDPDHVEVEVREREFEPDYGNC
ncbi:hypothetical protein EJV46_11870 [Roseococcus sp. SYP-B2431]|uniref:hypothetical protein n=1 Tax=Roseococcus sp. SYP-B2431 TaxID=2496640 RepID=UPI001039D6C1|nr:hypothetical protein [Roseococcus sp. SYP-B2431]TCH97911.1 hypothetical protein EJV46_11870 [Roseococcus sp. SYP-B2431]